MIYRKAKSKDIEIFAQPHHVPEPRGGLSRGTALSRHTDSPLLSLTAMFEKVAHLVVETFKNQPL